MMPRTIGFFIEATQYVLNVFCTAVGGRLQDAEELAFVRLTEARS